MVQVGDICDLKGKAIEMGVTIGVGVGGTVENPIGSGERPRHLNLENRLLKGRVPGG